MEPYTNRGESQLILKTYLGAHKFTGSELASTDEDRAYFKCDCGNKFSIRLSSRVKTPGYFKCRSCYNSVFAPNPGERYAFKRVAKDARLRGLGFNITLDFFSKQCHEPCHYCGGTDRNSISIRSKRAGKYIIKNFRYNGLDRKDNSKGYTEDNCVPACIVCNRAKREMPYDEFIGWLESLVVFRNGN